MSSPHAALDEAEAARPATMAIARTGATCRWSRSTRPTPRTTTTPSTQRRTPTPPIPAASSLTVAIADVAYYVRAGSALDREALERGNSVYFPDRVVPMLPERISNDLCSLQAARGPAGARGADDHRRGRPQAPPRVPSHHDALGGQALLRAGAGARSTAAPDETTAPLLEAVLRAALGRPSRDQARARPIAIRSTSTCPSAS